MAMKSSIMFIVSHYVLRFEARSGHDSVGDRAHSCVCYVVAVPSETVSPGSI